MSKRPPQTSLPILAAILVSALALWAVGAPFAAAAPPAQADGTYISVTVKPGDNLGLYARTYGTSGAAMLAFNHLDDPNLIYPGQVLVIPVVRSFTPSLTTPFYYVAQAGDTLDEVARRFEQDPGVVARVNGSAALTAGRTYLLPAGPHVYVVQRGDSMAGIAARYGVTVDFVVNANNLPNSGFLFAGQVLSIPLIFDAQPRPLPAPASPPAAAATPTPPAGHTAITVQSGDTLLVYVKRYGISARAIIDANPSLRVNPSLLLPGQVIYIPTVPAAAATAVSPTTTPSAAAGYFQAVVKAGDTLLTFVQRYGASASSLLAANPALQDAPDLIYPGQVLAIPVLSSHLPSRTTPFLYVVPAGETPALIAARFEMTADTLQRANPGASFAAGSTVLVPAGPHVYVVKAGDELRDVAALYGTTVAFLLNGNNLPNPDLIYAGQLIYIPVRYNAAPIAFGP